MVINLPISLHTRRDRVAFLLYSSGVWLSLVAIPMAVFMLGYAAQQNIALLSPTGGTFIHLSAQVHTADQLYEQTHSGTNYFLPFLSHFDVYSAFFAVALSFLAVGVLLIFAGYITRSRNQDTKLKDYSTTL